MYEEPPSREERLPLTRTLRESAQSPTSPCIPGRTGALTVAKQRLDVPFGE
jgi:hypothetical protein